MKEVTRYQCDYCDKIYKHKSSARKHERQCFANPATKACRTCKHCTTQQHIDGFEYLVCDAKKIYLNFGGVKKLTHN